MKVEKNIRRVGFACKYLHEDQSLKPKLLEEIQRPLTEKCTTVAWLNRQTVDVAEQRLWDIMVHNTQAVYNLIEWVGSQDPELRMVRIGSNQLPMYTQPDWSYFWKRNDVREYASKEYAKAGDLARKLDVRLSMHPGQFCVLASDNPDVVNRSIEEFEYHADIIRWLGYGKKFQDFKCNVHISGRKGPSGLVDVYSKLSEEARNTITIENDENSWGLDASLQLSSYIPLVLDIHHHWCKTGEYIQRNDDRLSRIIDTWQGVRPVMHYSVSREDYLVGHDPNTLPNKEELLEQGFKKAKLRAHSDYMWNNAVNEWASSFRDAFDIMVEAKMKNLASFPFAGNHKTKKLKLAA